MNLPIIRLSDARGRTWHPDWCARAHHCTAEAGGEHRSVPEVWETGHGRVVGTRYMSAAGRGWVEVRHVVPLPFREEDAQQLMRELIVAGNWSLDQVAGWHAANQRG
jgi:hypothetical protein